MSAHQAIYPIRTMARVLSFAGREDFVEESLRARGRADLAENAPGKQKEATMK